jgi:hypothetical protein
MKKNDDPKNLPTKSEGTQGTSDSTGSSRGGGNSKSLKVADPLPPEDDEENENKEEGSSSSSQVPALSDQASPPALGASNLPVPSTPPPFPTKRESPPSKPKSTKPPKPVKQPPRRPSAIPDPARPLSFFRQIFNLFLIFGTLAGLWLVFTYLTKPTLYRPFPYRFNFQYNSEPAYAEFTDENRPHVLILGDKMAVSFARYKERISEELSEKLKNPIHIASWASPKEGIHRTIHKIKRLTKLPPVIIYLGGSEDTFEKRYQMNDLAVILGNIAKYKDDTIKTILQLANITSKLIYEGVKRVKLEREPIKDDTSYTPNLALKQKELEMMLYELHIEELISLVSSKGSSLILVTIPLNLDIPPLRVCEITTSPEIIGLQDYLFKLYDEGDFKLAISEMKELKLLSPANAMTFYLSGMLSAKMGDIPNAVADLEQATIMDCFPWRANYAQNAIILQLARKNNTAVFDFHRLIHRFYGESVLFRDEFYPQDVLFKELARAISAPIKRALNL